MSKTKWALVAVVVIFIASQAVRPDMTPPPVHPSHTLQTRVAVPPEVDSILRRSCYDCHSSETRWPWYSQITPVSWFLADHVKEGRHELSFSEFATYPPKKAAKKLEELCEQAKKKEMPLKVYLPLHPDAKLTDADRQTLCDWAKGERAKMGVAGTNPRN